MTTCTTNPHQIRNTSTIRNEFTTSDPVSQESSTSVGLRAREKNGEGRSRTFWANRTPRSSTNRKQFWLPGLPEVITDGAIRQKTKFPTFSFPGTTCLPRVVLELRRKNEISEKESWLPWQRPSKIRKSRFRSFICSHSGTERWKPRENPSSGSRDNRADEKSLIKKKYATSVKHMATRWHRVAKLN